MPAMQKLPTLSADFIDKKTQILAQLSIPGSNYTDASPKGSVDEEIYDLLALINGSDGLVTTSSCAGRVCVFLGGTNALAGSVGDDVPEAGETTDRRPETTDRSQEATSTKSRGGRWLYVSHKPFGDGPGESEPSWASLLFGIEKSGETGPNMIAEEPDLTRSPAASSPRLIQFKFEPMILHLIAASPAHAQLVLRCALGAGFRESGATNLTSPRDGVQPTPMVAVRSAGLAFDTLIGFEVGGRIHCSVSSQHLELLTRLANERFQQNRRRIERFRQSLADAFSPGPERESSEARRERKRREGLQRQREVAAMEAGKVEAAMEAGGES